MWLLAHRHHSQPSCSAFILLAAVSVLPFSTERSHVTIPLVSIILSLSLAATPSLAHLARCLSSLGISILHWTTSYLILFSFLLSIYLFHTRIYLSAAVFSSAVLVARPLEIPELTFSACKSGLETGPEKDWKRPDQQSWSSTFKIERPLMSIHAICKRKQANFSFLFVVNATNE